MRYYVIINGVNSLSIKGLAIKTLPSIIKPMMRTLREEIDGRNGDVITNLGYSAYDKQLEIGLYGEYDIDSIMAYFNQKGTIIFSDEADKIYNFKILDQIDYAKLLKFKTAVVNLHIQPFKYPLSETPIELIDSYVEGEGESLTLNETESAPLEIDLKGNTSQVVIPGEEGLEEIDTSMTLTDVIPTKENYIIPKGNTSQVQYSGLQLIKEQGLSTPKTNTSFWSSTGDEFTPLSDGWGNYTFDNTNGSAVKIINSIIKIGGSLLEANKQYTIILETRNITYTGDARIILVQQQAVEAFSSGISDIYLKNVTGTLKYVRTTKSSIDGVTLTLRAFVALNVGDKCNFDARISIVEGDYTSTDYVYEPYCGGTPSPNPDYPQDIHSVSGDNEIEVCGKNRFDFEKYKANNPGATVTGTEDNFYTHYFVNFSYIYLASKENTAYTISYDWSTNVGNGAMRCFYTDGTNTQMAWNYSNAPANGSVNFTSDSNKTIEKIGFIDYKVDGGWTIQNLQIEEGSSKTEYEPYTGNTYHITLPNGIELNKIGTYQDYIYKSGSKWYLHKEIISVVFNGSENWLNTFGTNLFNFTSFVTNNPFIVGYGLSNYYKYNPIQSGINAGTVHGEFVLQKTGNAYNLFIKNTDYSTPSGFKTWLSTHNTTIKYPLATPTETEITDTTLLSQLDDLYNATIYETTNISSIPNDLEPFIDIKYNVVTPSPSPQRPSAINVVSGTNTITIANQDSSETQTLQIRLGSIKLRYVDEAQDYIYKSGDKWYTHALTGEKTFVGNSAEGWAMTSTPRGLKEFTAQISDMKKNSSIYCDNFTQVPETTQMAYETYTPSIATTNSKSVFIMLGDGSISAGSDFRTWLSTHNTTVVYPLNTAVDTEITDTDLLEDLEALLEAVSYANQTNISQTNNDKPFILYAKALKQGSGESIVENTGNIYAKPTFEIEGTGLVQVLIDNNQVLEVDTTNDTIVIDTENMEAINKTDGTLANRQVVGDYSKIKLNVGNNDVKLTGNYTKGTITKYTRYL